MILFDTFKEYIIAYAFFQLLVYVCMCVYSCNQLDVFLIIFSHIDSIFNKHVLNEMR